MRILTIIITLVIALKGCALPGLGEKASPPSAPVTDPGGGAPAASDGADKSAPEFSSSVPAAIWDSKAHDFMLYPVDPVSGQPVPGYAPVNLEAHHYHTYSPDGGTLAVLAYPSDASPHRPTIHVLDLAAWKVRSAELEVTGWAAGMAFSPDGARLAIGFTDRKSTLLIFDLAKNQVLSQVTTDFDLARLEFNTDGSAVMAYGRLIVNRFTAGEMSSGPAKAALFDAADLSVIWSANLKGVRDGIYPLDPDAEKNTNLHENPGSALYLYPGLVFAPDRDALYVVHADEDKLTTVDYGARSVSTVAIRPKLSWIERLLLLTAGTAHAKIANGTSRSAVISPDGGMIYTIGLRNEAVQMADGEWDFRSVSLGFQAIDPADGASVFTLDSEASDLTISPDGSFVMVHNWTGYGFPVTEVFTPEAQDFTMILKNAILRPIRRMDGELLLVSAYTDNMNKSRMAVYTLDGKVLGEWRAPVYADWLAIR